MNPFFLAVIVTVSCSIYEKEDVSVLQQRPPLRVLGLFSKAVQSAVTPSSRSDLRTLISLGKR